MLSHLRARSTAATVPDDLPADELPEAPASDLADGKPLEITLAVPEDAEHKGGLAVFGAETGRFPFDPTVVIRTEEVLPADLGVDPTESPAIDTAARAKVAVLRSGDASRREPTEWAYTTDEPGRRLATSPTSTTAPGSAARPASAPAARRPSRSARPGISPEIWLRKTVELPALASSDLLTLHLFHDEDVQVFVNGRPLYQGKGYLTPTRHPPRSRTRRPCSDRGRNTIAVHCRQTSGGQGIDLGLTLLKSE